MTIEEATTAIRIILSQTGEQIRKDSKRVGAHFARTFGVTTRHLGTGLASAYRRVVGARNVWLMLAELVGVVLVTLGVSFWSVPASLVLGGLVLVSALELRGNPTPKMPTIRPPEDLIRAQAKDAAIVINQERLGIGVVDQKWIDKLSIQECEKLIQLARAISGIKKT